MIFSILNTGPFFGDHYIVSLEEGTLTIADIETLIGSKDNEYFYSSSHLYEAEARNSNALFTKQELINKRLAFLSGLTQNKFLYQNTDGNLISVKKRPKEAYDNITDFPDLSKVNTGFTDIMPNEIRKAFRELLKIDVVELNNLSNEKAISYLDAKYQEAGLEMNFSKTIISIIQNIGNHLYSKISTIVGMLDVVGFYKDKETDRSDFARMWDTEHAFFAAHCDVYITNDQRTIKKTEVAYKLLGINTKILSTKP